MKISIEEQSPDGINLGVENLIVDTIEEANEFSRWIIKIWGSKKIDIKECEKIFEKLSKGGKNVIHGKMESI